MPGQPAGERKNMDKKDILSRVDHTLLSQTATWEEIRQILDDGIKYGCASACIPACYVKQAAEYVDGKLPICTVIGFPNGYSTTAVKEYETKDAILNGADEIDMVINLGDVKDKHFDKIKGEIALLKSACGDKILKVIIETCLLTEEEKIKAAGGISSFDDAEKFISLGASRLGTSRLIKIMKNTDNGAGY